MKKVGVGVLLCVVGLASCVGETEPETSNVEVIDESVDAVAGEQRRGDVNDDGRINISDAVAINMFLFSGGATPPCLDAADANSDGGVDVSDTIFILEYLFSRGPTPQGAVSCCADDTGCGHAQRCEEGGVCAACTVDVDLVVFEACRSSNPEGVRIRNNNDCNVDLGSSDYAGGCFYDTANGSPDRRSIDELVCSTSTDECLGSDDLIIRAGQMKRFGATWSYDWMWRGGETGGMQLDGCDPPTGGQRRSCGGSI